MPIFFARSTMSTQHVFALDRAAALDVAQQRRGEWGARFEHTRANLDEGWARLVPRNFGAQLRRPLGTRRTAA
jgi:hypothetical protein